ncbi:hypothetical protein D3C81_1693410 [compost metagenome]
MLQAPVDHERPARHGLQHDAGMLLQVRQRARLAVLLQVSGRCAQHPRVGGDLARHQFRVGQGRYAQGQVKALPDQVHQFVRHIQVDA